MTKSNVTQLPRILREKKSRILKEWVATLEAHTKGFGTSQSGSLKSQADEFLLLFSEALESADSSNDVMLGSWTEVRQFLDELSKSRARQGFSPTETALFVFSLKEPVMNAMQDDLSAEEIVAELWFMTLVIDKLGLYTTEVFQRSREEIIGRQQQELLELSTPVVELWDEILALPLIGTLDSARTQIVMENLLQAIVSKNASIAIIDITGVPTVDTLVAQHLLKAVSAARLMGADCIISGIRPQIAQTIVHLGVELTNVTTKATLADAFRVALSRLGRSVEKSAVNSFSDASTGRA